MAQITLNTKQVNELAAFLIKHDLKTFFMAKDNGAYVGATAGTTKSSFENVIFYFRGMNPSKDEFFYENADDAFGGDDFGEQLNAEFVIKMSKKHMPKVTIKVGRTQISMSGSSMKAPTPVAEKKAPTPVAEKKPSVGKKLTKGAQIRALLAKDVPEAQIVSVVGTTLNSVRWYKTQINKGN